MQSFSLLIACGLAFALVPLHLQGCGDGESPQPCPPTPPPAPFDRTKLAVELDHLLYENNDGVADARDAQGIVKNQSEGLKPAPYACKGKASFAVSLKVAKDILQALEQIEEKTEEIMKMINFFSKRVVPLISKNGEGIVTFWTALEEFIELLFFSITLDGDVLLSMKRIDEFLASRGQKSSLLNTSHVADAASGNVVAAG